MNINQAFIKAYRHDAAQPSPAAPMSEAAQPSRVAAYATAGAGRSMRLAPAEALTATISYISPASASDFDFGFDSETAMTHASSLVEAPLSPYATDAFDTTESLVDSPYSNSSAVSPALTPHIHRPASGKRPLSSFMKSSVGGNRTAMSLRPGTTVATFRLPPACRNLLVQHGTMLDGITEVVLQQTSQSPAIVGVLGLFRGVGCSTITLCLAARLAGRKRRVAVVDGHFQAPQMSSCLDCEPTAWWQDVLERGASLSDALVRAEDDAFDLLPLDPYTRIAPQALQLSATSGALRHAYDLVLVDLGTFFDPVSQPAALELMRHMRIESAVVVAGPAAHDPRDLESLIQRLDECNCQLLGAIENRVAK